MALTYRNVKGSALTINELDNNFSYFTGSHAITGSLTVSGSIIPAETNGTLGTADAPWKELFVDGGTIYFISGSSSGSLSWSSGSGFNFGTGSVTFDGGLTVTGSVTISGSSTLTNIGPFINTGNVTITGDLVASGDITGSDVKIDDWGSVSASLATFGNTGSVGFEYVTGVTESLKPVNNNNNNIYSDYSTIIAGRNHKIYSSAPWSVVSGNGNEVSGSYSFVHGNSNDVLNRYYTTVFGGSNKLSSPQSAPSQGGLIVGNLNNISASVPYILGVENTISEPSVSVAYNNTLIAGSGNLVSNARRVKIIGTLNTASHDDAIILGKNISSIAADTTHVGNLHASGSVTATTSSAGGLSITLTNLPTSDPGIAGRLWNDSGTLKISL